MYSQPWLRSYGSKIKMNKFGLKKTNKVVDLLFAYYNQLVVNTYNRLCMAENNSWERSHRQKYG